MNKTTMALSMVLLMGLAGIAMAQMSTPTINVINQQGNYFLNSTWYGGVQPFNAVINSGTSSVCLSDTTLFNASTVQYPPNPPGFTINQIYQNYIYLGNQIQPNYGYYCINVFDSAGNTINSTAVLFDAATAPTSTTTTSTTTTTTTTIFQPTNPTLFISCQSGYTNEWLACNAIVAGQNDLVPTGNVLFVNMNPTTPPGTFNPSNGTCNLASFTPNESECIVNFMDSVAGFRLIGAQYSGDSNYLEAIEANVITVNQSTTTTVNTTATIQQQSSGGGVQGSGGTGVAGGGSNLPTATKVNSCYMITNLTNPDTISVSLNNTKFNITNNFIGSSTAGVTVNDASYTLALNQTKSIEPSEIYNYSIKLDNIFWNPVEHTISISLCSNTAITNTVPANVVNPPSNTVSPSNQIVPANIPVTSNVISIPIPTNNINTSTTVPGTEPNNQPIPQTNQGNDVIEIGIVVIIIIILALLYLSGRKKPKASGGSKDGTVKL